MQLFKKTKKSDLEIFLEKIFISVENSLITVGMDNSKNKDIIRKKLKNHELKTMSDLKSELNLVSENIYFRLNKKVWEENKSTINLVENAVKHNLKKEHGKSFDDFLKNNQGILKRCVYRAIKVNSRYLYKNIKTKVEITLNIKRAIAVTTLGSMKELNSNLYNSIENLISKYYFLYTQNKEKFNIDYADFKKNTTTDIQDLFKLNTVNTVDIITSVSIEFNYTDSDEKDDVTLINTKLDKKEIRRSKRLKQLSENKNESKIKFRYVQKPMYGLLINTLKGDFIINFSHVYHLNNKKMILKKSNDVAFSDWLAKALRFIGLDFDDYFTEVYNVMTTAYNCRLVVTDKKGKKL